MRYLMPVVCVLGAAGILVISHFIAARNTSYHYSLYHEMVVRGAIVEAAVPPQHPADPVTADGSYNIDETVGRMSDGAGGAILVGWLGAFSMSLSGAIWFLFWPRQKESSA